ncbi:GNAT family N-acetyltransferase [Paucibacter sp. B2R-40]|uniref:GNAT family N-acetyltransferase n=1 Tax=Paucibacter sp. B2R-40 TaxID=2893554 RepID=UPI0021E44920|nr:GNAT family N-acetyltransferase [Paucibacter sp. B2R-40]MCV2353035.1 GNAT family N-acetyltransferase [Paucibacter sp. B2R-40]
MAGGESAATGVAALKLQLSPQLDGIDWHWLANVFERAPLGSRDPALLETSFRNSQVCCFARVDGVLIGAGRALTDRVLWTVIYDLALLPEHQGKGLGKAIMDSLAQQAGAANVMLYAAPGKQPFYAKLGFRPMKTAMAKFANAEGAQTRGMIE